MKHKKKRYASGDKLSLLYTAHVIFPAGARSAPAGPKIVLVPPQSIFIYIYIYNLSALEDHHAVYTRCIGRMHSLATTSGPARKVGVVSIIKMADLEQTLHNLSSSKIR